MPDETKVNLHSLTQRILMVCNGEERATQLLVENVHAALRDARLDYELIDFADAPHLQDLDRYSCVLMCAENLDALDWQNCAVLTSYVEQGGGLVMLRRAWHAELAGLAGLTPTQTKPKIMKSSDTSGGFCFVADTLPAFDGCRQDAEQIAGHAPLDIRPKEEALVFATNEQGFPVGWLNRHGSGRVIYWNSALLERKRMRGTIVQSIAAAQQVSILPIANVAVIQIDDFPAPLNHANMSAISNEFPGLDSGGFYTRIWHPDMLDLCERHNLTFTYFPTFNYNDKVAPPFPFDEWTHQEIDVDGARQPVCIYSARIASEAGELGLHGYNHMSLLSDTWPSSEAMCGALHEVAARWEEDTLVDLPTCYVPPNNEYDEQGLAALSAVLPSVKVICGSFIAMAPERGGQREFGEEPWMPAMFCIPRATSGYEFSGDMKFDALSQLGTSGIWTHFVHADDVFDHPADGEENPYCRNPHRRPWRTHEGQRGLLDEFEAWIRDFRDRFPWLRFVSTSDAHRLIQNYLQHDVSATVDQNGATIETTPDSYFQIRLNDDRRIEEKGIAGAVIVGIGRAGDSVTYTLLAHSSKITMPFEQGRRRSGFFDFARTFVKGIFKPAASV